MRKYLNRKVAENLRHPHGIFGIFVGKLMNHFNRGIINFTIDTLGSEKLDKIVEAGVGSGMAMNLCSQRFPEASLTGIDISKKMLQLARSRNRKSIRNGKMKLYLSDIADLPLNDKSVDVFYTINTLYFWNDPDLVFKEVYRVLKHNGRFVISFNPKEEMMKERYPKDLFRLYSSEEVNYLAETNKFKLISDQEFIDRYEKYSCLSFLKTKD